MNESIQSKNQERRGSTMSGWPMLPFTLLLKFGGVAMIIRAIIKRSFWNTEIDLSGMTSTTTDPLACKGAFKTIGNDGLFAMNGRFRSKKLGKFRAFVTNRENSVILKYPDRTIVISPENPRNFVNELNRRQRRRKEMA